MTLTFQLLAHKINPDQGASRTSCVPNSVNLCTIVFNFWGG